MGRKKLRIEAAEVRRCAAAMAGANLVLYRAAQALYMAPEPFQVRVERIRETTGLNIRTFYGCLEALHYGDERK